MSRRDLTPPYDLGMTNRTAPADLPFDWPVPYGVETLVGRNGRRQRGQNLYTEESVHEIVAIERRKALEEAATWFEDGTHTFQFRRSIAHAIRALIDKP